MNDGSPMPHWPETEKRMVLGFLAYQSQIKGGEQEADEAEKRRVVWKRQDMLKAIRMQLRSREYGRFTELVPEDAEELLKYFLHPSGLLTEPEEERIQFAHLSFQEYLCADYLSGRCKRKYITQELFSRLDKSGWDEVGLLLLTIRAEQERNEGHFEILSWLDLSDVHQAGLFIKAYTGRELPFTDADLEEWLPMALGCALLHPEAEWNERLARLPEGVKALWSDLLVQLFESENAEGQWDVLVATLREKTPFCLEGEIDQHAITSQAKQRWMNPKDDGSWPVVSDGLEARTYGLLNAVVASGGGKDKAEDGPSRNPPLLPESHSGGAIAEYLARNDAEGKPDKTGLLWLRKTGNETQVGMPGPTNAAYVLDSLLPERGDLWKESLRRIPLDGWLLQGEAFDDIKVEVFSQPAVLLSLFPKARPPVNIRLSIALYQAIVLAEGAGNSPAFDRYFFERSMSLSRSFSLRRAMSLYRSLSRSRSRSLFRSQSWYPLLSLSQIASRFRSMFRSISRPMDQKIIKIKKLFEKSYSFDGIVDPFFPKTKDFLYRYAAHDWFAEQAETPDLMRRRGLTPGEPLPKELNLFDADGRPLPVQNRQNWVRLRQWLDDDEAVLDFVFPDGLPQADRDDLVQQMALLRKQPWSPQAALDAVLTDWPEDQPERPYTLEHAEAELEKACDEFLAAVERGEGDGGGKRGR
jgi:hypothetical protein